MQTVAVVLREPQRIELRALDLAAANDDDVVVDVSWSAISTGTERLLWSGRMPPFPGMGYPLVPGYEATGEVVSAGRDSGLAVGDWVFVPGANCFGPMDGEPVRGLFGAAARRLVSKGSRASRIDRGVGAPAVLLALAATAHHALVGPDRNSTLPDLIIGHGCLGRLAARLTIGLGGEPPVVIEHNSARRTGALGYPVVAPDAHTRRDHTCVLDASGDGGQLAEFVGRTKKGGEIVLAGFYEGRLSFDFVPAFLRETRIRIAAEWSPADLVAVTRLVEDGRLSLDGLITHAEAPADAASAYATAFEDASCLKMILDWRALS